MFVYRLCGEHGFSLVLALRCRGLAAPRAFSVCCFLNEYWEDAGASLRNFALKQE